MTIPQTPEETRERVARLEERSIVAEEDRKEMKATAKETRADVKQVALTVTRIETNQDNLKASLEAHYEALKNDHKKEGRDAKGILGALALVLTAVAYGLLKQFGIAP